MAICSSVGTGSKLKASQMAAYVRISVLLWADWLAWYAMWVMVTYLTNVWNLDVTDASAIVNVWSGVSSILPLCMAFLVDSFMGHYWMLTVSSVSYCIGLGFLSMSTPPVLHKATGTCKAYAPQCIGHTQKALFYTALTLIAIGISGHSVSLVHLFQEQSKLQEDKKVKERKTIWRIIGGFAILLVPVIGGFALPYIKPWSVRFGIPAICTLVATIFYISGSRSYEPSDPQGSPLSITFRVFVASASKIFHKVKDKELYEIEEANSLKCRTPGLRFQFSLPQFNIYDLHYKFIMSLISSHVRKLMKCRCLEKAAIILPNVDIEEQKGNRWRLCKVSEVEQTKICVRWMPMWMTFLFCGVVKSIGNTYFVEQANKMNRHIGHWEVPLQILLVIYDVSKSQFASLYFCFATKVGITKSKRYSPAIGIGAAMIFSVLCCITAAKVEVRRLGVIKSHGLLDNPKASIPMSMFWLVPQFVLLAANDGISENSIKQFFNSQAPSSMAGYLTHFTNAVSGAGIVGSVLTVYVVEKISERGGKPSWFQDTLNRSRLDKYYWTLAGLSAVNFLLYVVTATCYRYRDSESENLEKPEFEESQPQFDDSQSSCCC
ncbi:Proton-dependent oligopeptide transporter family [Dillenia turbinata]|uniref:Proton-dependent oligopeptide transporter family n=1 Tax=Dillenia turbinata TaxID=194707 RepID=A0AAN8WCV4_9MAGN